ncbi:hypothetical protein G7Y89_g6273 [Cudoniella acicularis]|uniref:Uncharacterized protein n=1 Tax=Cudoniella acicularis TaxID=354080 RepID=A0A8H4W361_9HELO|nr:hypothetical protein G7Y89_g6273 [Cudoniella acicularis]
MAKRAGSYQDANVATAVQVAKSIGMLENYLLARMVKTNQKRRHHQYEDHLPVPSLEDLGIGVWNGWRVTANGDLGVVPKKGYMGIR